MKSQTSWINEIRVYLRALSMPIPENAVCSHFGVSFRWYGKSIGLSDRKGVLLVTVYASEVRGYSARTFRRWRSEIRSIAPISTCWNGKPGNNGISIVLARPTPDSLFQAQQRYPRSTSFGLKVFREAFNQNLVKARKEEEDN